MSTKTPENPLIEIANTTVANIKQFGDPVDPDKVVDIDPTRRAIKKDQLFKLEKERQLKVDDELSRFSMTLTNFVIGVYLANERDTEEERREKLTGAMVSIIEASDVLAGTESDLSTSKDEEYVSNLVDQIYPIEDGYGGLESDSDWQARIGREVVRPAIFGELLLDEEFVDHQALRAA